MHCECEDFLHGESNTGCSCSLLPCAGLLSQLTFAFGLSAEKSISSDVKKRILSGAKIDPNFAQPNSMRVGWLRWRNQLWLVVPHCSIGSTNLGMPKKKNKWTNERTQHYYFGSYYSCAVTTAVVLKATTKTSTGDSLVSYLLYYSCATLEPR